MNREEAEAKIRSIVSGSYSGSGVEAWFDRPRGQLDGKTPRQVLDENTPDGIKKVMDLAEWLISGGGAT